MSQTDGGYLEEEAKPVILIIGTGLIIMLLGIIFSFKQQLYQEIKTSDISIREINIPNSKIPIPSEISKLKKIKMLFSALISFYIIIAWLYRSLENVDDSIISSPLINISNDFLDYLDHRCKNPNLIRILATQNKLRWFEYCKSINDLILQQRSEKQVCFPDTKYETDFSFLKRTPNSPIKNVFVFFLESVRAEMFPFDYESRFARKVLREQTRIDRSVTPHIEELVQNARYTTKGRAMSSFTIKSMIGALCSVYTYPQNYCPEYYYNYYHTCLPELLAKYANMSTAFIEPLMTDYYNHHELLLGKGFKDIYNAERVKAGEFGEPPSYKYINGLGYEDGFYRKIIKDYVKNQTKLHKNFMIAYAASVTHADFTAPRSWRQRPFNTNSFPFLNKYTNALCYIDNFINDILKDFREMDLLKDTLFIFLGDHGLSLGEHNVWYTTDIQYETQFNIPIIMYTENELFNQKFPPGKFDEHWNTLDVMPTILDALRFDGSQNDFSEKYLLEGQSMIRKNYENRVMMSLSNPGLSTIVLRENNWKVVLPGMAPRDEEIYDLSLDEYEDSKSLVFDSIGQGFKNWVREMRIIRTLYIDKVKEWYENALHEKGSIANNTAKINRFP